MRNDDRADGYLRPIWIGRAGPGPRTADRPLGVTPEIQCLLYFRPPLPSWAGDPVQSTPHRWKHVMSMAE